MFKSYSEYYTQKYEGLGFDGAYGIGFLCGSTSGSLEVIDIDSKYQEHRDLFGGMKELICNVDELLWQKMVIERSPSGGFHLFYRCKHIEGNQKLANRLPNAAEIADAKAKDSKPPQQVVLIETRGIGGFIMTAPSPKYELIQHDFSMIPTISIEEREMIIDAAKSFNEVEPPKKPTYIAAEKKNVEYGTDNVPCWVDYNNKNTCLDLLLPAGWRIVSQRGDMTHLLRPGTVASQKSATFFSAKNRVVFFTSSCEFDTWQGKGSKTSYTPFAIYATWNHAGDKKAAAKDLYKQGYGTRFTEKEIYEQGQEKPDFLKGKNFEYKEQISSISAEEKTYVKLDFSPEIKDAECLFLCEEGTAQQAFFEKEQIRNVIYINPKFDDEYWHNVVNTLGTEKRYILCEDAENILRDWAKQLAAENVLAEVYYFKLQQVEPVIDMEGTGDVAIFDWQKAITEGAVSITYFLIGRSLRPLEDVASVLMAFPSIAKITSLVGALPKKPQGLKQYCRERLKYRKEEEKEQRAAKSEENAVVIENGETLAKGHGGWLVEVCKGELSIPYQLPGDNDSDCEWIMQHRALDEVTEKVKDTFMRMDNDMIGSKASMLKLFRKAQIEIKLNTIQLENLNNALTPKAKLAERNDTLGWHTESALWFFFNQAHDYQKTTFLTPNEISIIEKGGTSFYLPHHNDAKKSVKKNRLIHSFAYRHSSIMTQEIAKFYHKQWGEQGVLALMWGIASAYVDFISVKANPAAPFFPLLYVQGQRGSGKTTMLELFRFFYTEQIETVSLRSQNNTAAAIQSTLCKYANLPILFDDYGSPEGKASTDLATGVGVSAYNRRVELKRDINDLSKVQNPAISATLMFSSNYYPKDPSGAFQNRLMHFKIDKTVFTAEESAAFLEGMKKIEEQGIVTAFIFEIIGSRAHIETEFEAEYHKLLRYFKSTTSDYEIDARQISIYSMITAVGLILTRHEVSFGLSEMQIKEAARAAIIRQFTSLQTQTPIQTFWEIIKMGVENGLVLFGVHFDFLKNGYVPRNKPERQIKGEVLMINFPQMWRIYAMESARVGIKPESSSDILSEIKRSSAFVSEEVEGQPKSRIGAWRFGVASEAQNEEADKKQKVTTAWALRLGELENNFGFAIPR